MQKIVLFIEPHGDEWRTPFKMAELVMNQFYFEEEASFKIVKIFELAPSYGRWTGFEENKGMSLSI